MHMGLCAEACAEDHRITREEQDAYAQESTRRAVSAQEAGHFQTEIAPVEVGGGKGEPAVVSEDEGPRSARVERIPRLRPAFKPEGTVTAGNASSINDGAAAVVLMSAERARRERRPVLGRLTGWGGTARKPVEFTVAPADAVRLVLDRAGLTAESVDLWEINEAFAVVALANMRLLGLDPRKVNARGGAVVLGHPIGASGARILVTLLYAMRDLDRRRGLATLCIGGGEAVALLVERGERAP